MIPQPRRLKRVTLETTLKPFFDLSDAGIDATCRKLWTNWRHLVSRCDDVAVLLWVGAGDDIMAWSGDMDALVPVTQTIGFNNLQYDTAYDPEIDHYRRNAAQPYSKHAPRVTYTNLKRIVAALRETCEAMLGKRPAIGATVDPGPEFVDSPWRFEQHPEILQTKQPHLPYPMHFISHQTTLNADPTPHAGFPDGIPAGISYGTFLGRQFKACQDKLGYDLLWLSNGMAYSHHPWISRGDLFDGVAFHPDRVEAQRGMANDFWRDLRAETDVLIDVRGTNFAVGMDVSTDGCSHKDIWEIGQLQRPPCNPPWGSRALGLEMTAFLSRLAKTPTDRLPFRFYLNDPWFVVTSWYDYYGQEPFDVYVPMAGSRMNARGGVDTPTDLNLLTIDTSYGDLLEDEAAEFTPHMLTALDRAPDAAGPVVWVYPFDEYDGMLTGDAGKINYPFAHDWFICRAADAGLPLNTVCASDVFVALHEAGRLPDSVYVAPVPADKDWAYGKAIVEHVKAGGKVLLYGATDHAPAELLELLAIDHADPIEGELAFESTLMGDRFERATPPPSGSNPLEDAVGLVDDAGGATVREGALPLIHRSIVSGGGITETCGDAGAVRATAAAGDTKRAYAIVREQGDWHGGKIAWLRSTVGFDPTSRHLEAAWDKPGAAVQAAELARYLLNALDYQIVQDRLDEAVRAANVFIKRHANGWYVVGHKPDTSARFWLRTPDGAPAYEECETRIVDGRAGETFGKTFHKLVRAFVKMDDGIVRVKRLTVPVGYRYHCSISDLVDADVTIYPNLEARPIEEVDVQKHLWTDPVECKRDAEQGVIRVRHYTGALFIKW